MTAQKKSARNPPLCKGRLWYYSFFILSFGICSICYPLIKKKEKVAIRRHLY